MLDPFQSVIARFYCIPRLAASAQMHATVVALYGLFLSWLRISYITYLSSISTDHSVPMIAPGLHLKEMIINFCLAPWITPFYLLTLSDYFCLDMWPRDSISDIT